MKFFQSALVLGLATSVFATPIPQDSNTDITKRLVELEDAVYGLVNEKREAKPDFLNHFETRATIKDTTCPDNGLTYPKDAIMGAVQAENQRTNPGTYGNQEGGGVKLFNTNDQLYKVSLDRKLLMLRQYIRTLSI
jgi:hypothetical protein